METRDTSGVSDLERLQLALKRLAHEGHGAVPDSGNAVRERLTASAVVDLLLNPNRRDTPDIDDKQVVAALLEATHRYARHMHEGEFKAATEVAAVLMELAEWAVDAAEEKLPD